MSQAQMDPTTAYSQLNPQQRSAVAQEFMNQFRQYGNEPEAQQFMKTDPQNVSPQQLAAMHKYAADKHPGILGVVMKHPVMTAVLAGFAAYELDKHLQHH